MDVLSSTEISAEVVSLVENARQFLLLVSPYFDPWDRLTGEIKRAANRPNMQVVLLLRGGEDRAKQEEKARALVASGVRVEFLARLHAKVYINESQALVTSMNLLKSSALDSWELALRADRERDAKVYGDILTHTRALVKRALEDKDLAPRATANREVEALTALFAGGGKGTMAKVVEALVSAAAPSGHTAPPAAAKASRGRTKVGHCIRCGDEVPFNAERPLCGGCYAAWAKYKNPEFKEKHCHSCGKERATSVVKPLCKPCWEAEA